MSNARKAVAMAATICALLVCVPSAHALSNEVLILGPTVSGGASSLEAQAVAANGLTPVVVDNAAWQAMSSSQFASYRAIVLGDATCADLSAAQAAQDTVDTWGPSVTGNVLINGTDPVYHAGQGGAAVTRKGIDFAIANADKTGAYISLSCYYHDTAPDTPVPLLDAIRPGGFTLTGVGCYNDAHIVATHPALDSLTDANLSGWSCSVHEAFDRWPADFTVLAIAKDFGSAFTASDGTIGTPYILASGTGLRSFPLSLDPTSQTVAPGTTATVTAQLLDSSTRLPVSATKISFRVSAGPHAGAAGACLPVICLTGSTGRVQWSYRATSVGTDTVQAWLDQNDDGVPSPGEPQTTAAVRWETSAVPEIDYVALGDSYSSGEGTYNYDEHAAAQTCHRGPGAWPRIIESKVVEIPRIEHKACTGAKAVQLLDEDKSGERQIPLTPNPDVDLVTLTAGGNDVDFERILKDCVRPGTSCAGYPDSKSFEKKLDTLYKKLTGDVYPALEAAYPNARIVHVGYPRLTPKPEKTPYRCGWLGADEQEAGVKLPYMLNGTIYLASQTRERIEWLDVTNILEGRELCTRDSWMVPLVSPFHGSEQGHPTTAGQRAYAAAVAKGLGFSFLPEF